MRLWLWCGLLVVLVGEGCGLVCVMRWMWWMLRFGRRLGLGRVARVVLESLRMQACLGDGYFRPDCGR